MEVEVNSMKLYKDYTTDTTYGYLGFSAKDVPSIWESNGNTKHNLLHSGNYTNHLPFLNSTTVHATNTSIIYAPDSGGSKG